MTAIHCLTRANYGVHFADQTVLVATPLVAALVFESGPETIGLLVAAQSSAHLLGSIPFGILVDHRQLRTLSLLATLVLAFGCALAAVSIAGGSAELFCAGITLAGFGTVLFGLTTLSILPRVAASESLARANAAIQLPRALCSFAVPLLVGVLAARVPGTAILSAAGAAACYAMANAAALPRLPVDAKPAASVTSRILEGGRFAFHHPLLLPITLCSVAWNLAFASLLVILVPVIRDIYRFEPGNFGIALSAFGLGAIAGASLSGHVADKIRPSLILLFGPGSSACVAAALLFIESGMPPIWLHVCFFWLGFGPSMWLVAQNAVRQLVSPPDMLGRVNAVIQTAIYGVRPLGALADGAVAGVYGPVAGLWLVVIGFGLSFAVSVLSDLRRITSFDALRPSEVGGLCRFGSRNRH